MRINTNVSSMTALESNRNTNFNLQQSLEKLSSGLRINKAADDASGMAIADKLRTQASSLKQGISNANSAASLIQIADKAMAEQSNILDIVKTKLIQASTSTTTDAGREAIRKDISKLLEQLDMIAAQTNYNGTTLLQAAEDNTAIASTLTFQLGETTDFTVSASLNYASNSSGLGGGADSLGDGQTFRGIQDQEFNVNGGGDTVKFVTTATTDKLDLDGKLGTLEATDTVVVVGNDAATRALLDIAAASSSVTKTGTGTNATYTFEAGNSIDFGDTVVDITINSAAAGKSFDINTSDSFNAKIDNLSAADAITISVNGAGNLTGGDLLSALKGLGTDSLTVTKANAFMSTVDEALTQLNDIRASFGSTQNQLESSIRNMQTTHTNLKAAESVIRDVDYAAESANFNKQNIISQAGTYAISQANNVQQNVLKLLQ